MKRVLGVALSLVLSACSASLPIIVTDTDNGAFLLVNDGAGNFTVTRRGIPRLRQGYYTSEVIDLDDDGYCDLIVGGHEHERASTRIYWGAASHSLLLVLIIRVFSMVAEALKPPNTACT